MSREGSHPHTQPAAPQSEPESPPAGGGARVLAFPSEEASPPEPGSAPGDANNPFTPDEMNRPDELSAPGVPAGTWADEDSDAAAQAEQHLSAAGGKVVEFPRAVDTHTRRRANVGREERSVDTSGTQRTQSPEPSPEADERPAYLASELLRFDWWPSAPLARPLRIATVSVGVVGAVTVLGVAGFGAQALALSAVLALCAVAGVLPLTVSQRAMAVTGTGLGGAIWVSYVSATAGDQLATPLLSGCIALAASALLFRAVHPLSKLARAMVGVGIASAVAWLTLSGGLEAMVVETLAWQYWLGPASRALLGVVLLGAALSYVDPNGHGGAWASAIGLVAWLAAYMGAVIAVMVTTSASTGALLTAAALPFFVALAAMGLCQAWVHVSLVLRRRSA
ncbi:MAG: hypothetical protein AB8I08_24605 [Sandaracinaceae bacterium]